jgi:YfiR/HmsC-like
MAGASVFKRRCITRSALFLAALLLAAPLVGASVEAQSVTDEAQVKAMFVYNFLKFVEWPGESRRASEPFVVLIVGEGSTADATARFLESKTIGERPVFVRRTRWDQSLAGARAAFVIERDAKKLRRILAAAAAAGVLTIGEGESFTTSGGVIGLLVEDRKVRFDVDTSAAQVAGLRVSSKLLALTRTVRSSTNRSDQ